MDDEYEDQKVLTVNADLVALATLRQCNSISSTKTSLVSSIPSATIARLSPTRIISIPAASPTWADGKSWAVITVMGSFLRYIDRMVPMVTFLREGVDDAAPRGECELWRVCGRERRGRVARRVRDDCDGINEINEDDERRDRDLEDRVRVARDPSAIGRVFMVRCESAGSIGQYVNVY